VTCDGTIASNTTSAVDFAKAIDICQTATAGDKKWGVIPGPGTKISLVDGTGSVDPAGHSVRPRFGTAVMPKGGTRLAILSTGAAAATGDTNPAFKYFGDGGDPIPGGYSHGESSAFPSDFLAANGGKLPNAPGCPSADMVEAYDPVMLTLKIRVPSNAHSFKLSVNFFSSEFPEFTCSAFNDFFVVLLDSTYTGSQPNPMDKNLAFFQPMNSATRVPVGVNLASGNTGLFTQCVNGATGCRGGTPGSISTCTGVTDLAGTGFEKSSTVCDSGAKLGGATGWLVTSGNVVPGEVITLRLGIWDTSDHRLDSLAVIDGFQWSPDLVNPGTVIL
jgi:hypothetical protein